jgi:protein-S-isoprenylcysteine O-methyltransferase Ste14
MSGSRHGWAWLVAGYAGLGGFLALEATTRQPGEASSLEASTDDAGTTRLILNAYSAAIALPVVGLVVRAGRLPNWVRPAGLAVELTGLALRWWSMSTLKASYSRTLRNAQEGALIEDGPYAIVRHPGYLGSILTWVGFSLTSASGPTVAAVSGMLGAAYRRRIAAEEALLVRDLPGYVEYQQRTSGLIPRIWRSRRPLRG